MTDQPTTGDPQPPMLFDVVIPGDYLKPAGVWLPRGRAVHEETEAESAPAAKPSIEDIELRINRAIDEIMPEVTEQVTRTARQLLQERLREKLRRPPEAKPKGPQDH